jgi:RNA polymerase sigma factor (sigma-70 family)
MTDLVHDVDAPSDAELISRVRGGDVAAYGELFSRHVEAAKRLSRQLVRGPDADDLVSEAFAKVLTVLQGGGGPDVAFRAYLLTSVRRLHVDRIRSGARLQTSDDMEAFDPGVPFQDTAVEAFESGAAAKAFASLPERWQLVLWHLEVEGQKPADVAPLLGMSPNSVSALAYRAREGLRQAFLTMHLNDISETDCRWVNEHLGAYVRNGLAKRESTKVQAHLDECRRCTAMYLELTEVNSNLRGIIGPLLLGAAATGYLASSGTAAGGLGLAAVFGRVRDTVSANAGAATAGAVAAGVAAVVTAGIMLLPSSGPEKVVGADQPVGTVSTPGGPASTGASKPDQDKKSPEGIESPAAAASSPAALPSELPSELPLSPTVAPGVQTVQGTADQPGGTDQGGDGATGTTNPSETASAEPGPNEPGPNEPGPNQPGPNEPGPGQPTPAPPITLTVVAGPASIANGQVSFDVTGEPELPPALSLDLQSQPAGITFGGDGTCKVRAGDATVADCDTSPLTALASLPFARTLLAGTLQTFQVRMPLAGTPVQDTLVGITLRDDKGVELARTQALYDVAEPVPTADVSLTGFPATVSPTNVHDYVVTGTLGVSGYAGDVVLTVSDPDGRVRFVDSGVAGCTTQSARSVVCPAAVAGSVTLPLYVQDNRTDDTEATISVARADGSPDADPTNDSKGVLLERFRPTPVDAGVDASAPERGNSGKADVTVSVTTSDSTVPVSLTATYDPLIAPAPAGCTATASGATCSSVGGQDLVFTVDVDRIGNQPRAGELLFAVSVPEAYVDTDPANDTDLVTVTRFEDATASTTSQLRTAADSIGAVEPTSSAEPSTTTKQPVADGLSDSRQTVNATKSAVGKRATAHGATSGPGKGHAGHEATQGPVADPVTGDAAASPTPGVPGNGYGIGQGNGNGPGNGVGQGNEKKEVPSPIAQVVDTLSSLLP